MLMLILIYSLNNTQLRMGRWLGGQVFVRDVCMVGYAESDLWVYSILEGVSCWGGSVCYVSAPIGGG
jgi:hypothetical protein